MNIIDVIGEAKTIGIAGHIRPDGDCIGSCLALNNYLKKNYPELTVNVYLDPIDDQYSFIAGVEDIKKNTFDGTKYDLFIALDTASKDRLGQSEKYFDRAERTACIDHHKSNAGYADFNHIVPEASSACEVLFDFLDYEKMDETVAQPMYMGIATDSGVFRYQQTSSHTMYVAGKLMEFDFDHNKILEEIFYGKTYDQLRVTAEIQDKSELLFDGKLIYGYCSQEMMDKHHVDSTELDAVIASLRNVNSVEVAMFMYQLDSDKYKVSLRSKKYVDVAEIAVKFGGGGHMRASGFDIKGDLEEVKKKIIDEIEKVI